MRVLFVSSANRKGEINPVVYNQGLSLLKEGIDLRFFGVRGKGASGYLRNTGLLRKQIRDFQPDIVHAHYLLSGAVATLAGARPLVVSLMGSDVHGSRRQRFVSSFMARHCWKVCIVKTVRMQKALGTVDSLVIPNGVDLELFRPGDREEACREAGWDSSSVNVLFPSDPGRAEKNYLLAEKAAGRADDSGMKLRILRDVSRENVVNYLNAADAVLLTSLWEGSPNIIKEAMACNIPVVSTDVGDVREITGETSGCFITGYDADEISEALLKAVKCRPTDGRRHIEHLDAGVVARRLINVYTRLAGS
jgi:glycosyltransferase involved in cell wall biosynthesis